MVASASERGVKGKSGGGGEGKREGGGREEARG